MSKILEIPEELFFHIIFKYVGVDTLFETVPLVCKHFNYLFENLLRNGFFLKGFKNIDYFNLKFNKPKNEDVFYEELSETDSDDVSYYEFTESDSNLGIHEKKLIMAKETDNFRNLDDNLIQIFKALKKNGNKFENLLYFYYSYIFEQSHYRFEMRNCRWAMQDQVLFKDSKFWYFYYDFRMKYYDELKFKRGTLYKSKSFKGLLCSARKTGIIFTLTRFYMDKRIKN